MRGILAGVMLALAVSVPAAKACEAVIRTREEVLKAQRHLASTADSIYLARAVSVSGGYMSTYHRVVVIDGVTPPRRLRDWPEDCGRADEGLTVVFAQRVRPTFKLFDHWFWGGWVLSAFYPSEIADPEIAKALREAAERLRSN